MSTTYERDAQWLQDNGYPDINAEEFSDRVTRTMEEQKRWDGVADEIRNQVVIDMMMEQ